MGKYGHCLLKLNGECLRVSTSQELSEKLSGSPVLGARGHLAFTGAALGWAARTVLTSMAPGVLGVCPCLACPGIMPSSLSSEQGWLELDERQNRLKLPGDTSLKEPVTESQARGVWELLSPICLSKWDVYYLPREASGHACLGAHPELTDPPELDGQNQPFSSQRCLGPFGIVLLPSSYWWVSGPALPAALWTSHSEVYGSILLACVSDLLLVSTWAPTQFIHLGLCQM